MYDFAPRQNVSISPTNLTISPKNPVVLDQTTWAPFWNNVYIIMLGVMRCQHPSVIWGDIRRTTIPLIVSGLKLWPAAHIITYGYVNVEHRLLWVDIVEILWVTILATQAAGKQKVRRKKKVIAEAAAMYRDEEDGENGGPLLSMEEDEEVHGVEMQGAKTN
jgi:hypothetical protein